VNVNSLRRRRWFAAGDFALITGIGALNGLIMSSAHGRLPGFWLATSAGMIAGWAAGALAALPFRPLLGSIETTVPVMVGGMAAAMSVCVAMAFSDVGLTAAATIGAVAASLVHLYLARLGRSARRRHD